MSEKVLRLLGLGLRAQTVVIGVSGVRAALQRGTVHCIVVAADGKTRITTLTGKNAQGQTAKNTMFYEKQ